MKQNAGVFLQRQRRRGFALLVVLWVLAAASMVMVVITMATRDGIAAARNRMSTMRAAWSAEGCAERTLASIDAALSEASETERVWRALDSAVSMPLGIEECTMSLRPVGLTLNVNNATGDQLRRLLKAAGRSEVSADSLADALLDWRDADDDVREHGAERSWYRSNGRLTPRNAPIQSPAELALVRGVDGTPRIDTFLGVEPDRVILSRAPLPVIAALPGMSQEAVQRVDERRRAGAGTLSLSSLAGELSPVARQLLLAHMAVLGDAVVVEPEYWTLVSDARSGHPSIRATLEIRLVRAGRRAAILHRRSER